MATLCVKPVSREVVSGGKAYIVTMTHAGVTIREKGKRTTYGPVSWGLVLQKGAEQAAVTQIRERQEAHPSRRVVRRVSRGLLSVGGFRP